MRWIHTNCIQVEMLQPAYFIFEQNDILCMSRARSIAAVHSLQKIVIQMAAPLQ